LELFQFPALSLYRRSIVAFNMLTVRPLTVASFSQSAADTLPALIFFTGPVILFHLGLVI
jgi:hypothetical protein